MSCGQSRKSVPIDRFSASREAAVGTENLPPHSLCDFWLACHDSQSCQEAASTGASSAVDAGATAFAASSRSADCANAVGKGIESDEAGGITLLVHIILTERHEPLVIKRILARATDDGDVRPCRAGV